MYGLIPKVQYEYSGLVISYAVVPRVKLSRINMDIIYK
jgi:hypothetical protein